MILQPDDPLVQRIARALEAYLEQFEQHSDAANHTYLTARRRRDHARKALRWARQLETGAFPNALRKERENG